MIKHRLTTTIVLALLAGPAGAQLPSPGLQSPTMPMTSSPITAPPSVATSRGSGLVSGSTGSPQTIMLPGSAVPGLLLNNGNGTSTIMVPGSPSEVVPTPR